MESKYIKLAEAYYTLVGAKDIEGVSRHLHPNVVLKSPLTLKEGKEAVVDATKGYMDMIESLRIRSKCGSDGEAVIVYDVDIPGISSGFPAAVLLSFEGDLITKLELFFDASVFQAQS